MPKGVPFSAEGSSYVPAKLLIYNEANLTRNQLIRALCYIDLEADDGSLFIINRRRFPKVYVSIKKDFSKSKTIVLTISDIEKI